MARVRVKVDDQFPARLANDVKAAAGRAAKIAYYAALRRVPRDTGALAASIKVTQEGMTRFVLRATEPYAEFVEFGTVINAAQPFMTPAIIEARKALMADLKRIFS